MHNSSAWVCNPMQSIYENGVLIQKTVFKDVGGSLVTIEDNAFYRGGVIDLNYPNINDCNDATYNYFFPKIEINGNYFSTPAHAVAIYGNSLDWTNNGIPDGYDKIRIGDIYHYNYLYNGSSSDPHIQLDEGTGTTFVTNKCEAIPFSLLSQTPISQIASVTNTDLQNGGSTTSNNKTINEGETIWFDTHLCKDKDRNQPPSNDMLYFWRFHNEKSDLTDEFRTDNTNITGLIPYQFNKIGISNVTLMNIDKTQSGTNEWRASDLAKQLITVVPNTPAEYLSFWIKDTYVGRTLTPYGQFNHGVDDGRNPPPAQSPTGFEKFAAIDGDTLWTEDIEGDEGWQYVKIFLGHGQPGSRYSSGTLEIGIRSVSAVKANRVRGVTLFVDDVYISCNNGTNAITNGDFETLGTSNNPHTPTSFHAIGWTEFNGDQITALTPPFTNSCNGLPFTYNPQGLYVASDEARSGKWAYKGWIKNVAPEEDEKALTYKFPYTYKSIKQHFDLRNCVQQLNSNLPDFELYPNPSESNKKLTVKCEGKIGD